LEEIESYLTVSLPRFRSEDGTSDQSLTRMRRFVDHLGDPQEQVPVIHVAGTAGKGTVAAYVSEILAGHGLGVGTHLSPHVVHLWERFMVNGGPPASRALDDAFAAVVDAVEETQADGLGTPSFFEVVNGLMFRLFATLGLDRVVVEVDLGGRFDSTNVIRRRDKLAVITRIGLDHIEVLGSTIADIAGHKAGILPERGRAVVLRQPDPVAEQVVVEVAEERRCQLIWVDPVWTEHEGAPHLAANRALAVAAAGFELGRAGLAVDGCAVDEAIARSALPGRFERRLAAGRVVVLDGAHNPEKLAALLSVVEHDHPGRRCVFVLAVAAGKDVDGVLAAIAPVGRVVVATGFGASAGAAGARPPIDPAVLAARARAAGVPAVVVEPDPVRALARAVDAAVSDEPVVVTGSFYLVAALAADPAIERRLTDASP
jgi:dihydrofolate synthase/folylpolyglutamate synthase